MKPLCTFTHIAEFQRALPAHDPVTLRFTPEYEGTMPFSLLEFKQGQGIVVEAVLDAEVQSREWTVSRTELDGALTVFQRSPAITVADHHGALVLIAGTNSVMLSQASPVPQVKPLNPAIRPLASRSSAPAADPPVIRPIAPRSSAPVRPPVVEAPAQTQAYRILEAALHLSDATNGAPILEQFRQGFQITISDALIYQIDTAHENATVIRVIAGSARWNTRYPALAIAEWDMLVQLSKKLGAASLRRNREGYSQWRE